MCADHMSYIYLIFERGQSNQAFNGWFSLPPFIVSFSYILRDSLFSDSKPKSAPQKLNHDNNT